MTIYQQAVIQAIRFFFFKSDYKAWASAQSLSVFIFISGCLQYEDGTGSLPDPSLPLAHQLEFALAKIREHVHTVLDTQATCNRLDEVQYSVRVDTNSIPHQVRYVVFF